MKSKSILLEAATGSTTTAFPAERLGQHDFPASIWKKISHFSKNSSAEICGRNSGDQISPAGNPLNRETGKHLQAKMIDLTRGKGRPKTIIDIDHGYSIGAGSEHAEQC